MEEPVHRLETVPNPENIYYTREVYLKDGVRVELEIFVKHEF